MVLKTKEVTVSLRRKQKNKSAIKVVYNSLSHLLMLIKVVYNSLSHLLMSIKVVYNSLSHLLMLINCR